MFGAIISPILRSTRLYLQLVVHSTDDAASRQYRRCFIPHGIEKVKQTHYRPGVDQRVPGS